MQPAAHQLGANLPQGMPSGVYVAGTLAGRGEARPRPLAEWQRFVLVHGVNALGHDLAAILGRELAEIEALRQTGAASGRGRARGRKSFAELFELWHGRPPRDDEWRKPVYFEKRGAYEWLPLEVALTATLVGNMGVTEIAEVLTARLRAITNDERAVRTPMAVQNHISRMGLQASDVLGGITASAAGREIGSYTLVHQAIRSGQLRTRYVGRLLVISHQHWAEWKARIQAPPEGYVQLSTLKEALSIASDKLSEFGRMGYIPGAVQVKPYGTKNMHTTQFGSWYVPQAVADSLLANRREGKPMPWHGKPLMDNLKVTYRLWEKRRHPTACPTCQQIWGDGGAPSNFDAYIKRYPALAHGAKRHLTMVWSAGLTTAEVAQQTSRTVGEVKQAIANGLLNASEIDGEVRITRTDATRWKARKCPTGEGDKSWIAVSTAMKQYLFTLDELSAFMADGRLKSKLGTDGAMRGITYVLRHQCGQLRETLGFSHEQAAARARVSEAELGRLLQGVDWRGAGGIPLSTLQAVIKRVRSCAGFDIDEAAKKLGVQAQWVRDRIADGTVALRRNQWHERTYITAPMLARLQAAQMAAPRQPRLGAGWARLAEAAGIAGVSTTTLGRWADDGELRTQTTSSGRRFHEDDVRARARLYWQTVRFKRAKRPAWLRAELEGGSEEVPAHDDTQVGHAMSTPPPMDTRGTAIPPAAQAAQQAQEAVAPSGAVVDGLIAWMRSRKVFLNPLKALRAQQRAIDGHAREAALTVDRLLRRSHASLLDLDLIAFGDLDARSRREAVDLAMAFVGARRECMPAVERDRMAAAIDALCAPTGRSRM